MYTYFDISLCASSGCRTLCRVSKLPGQRVLCGSLSQRGEGGSANRVEVQQRYRTLSVLQHQLHAVVSGHTTLTRTHTAHTHTNERFHTRVLLCFSCTVMDERGCPIDTRTGWAASTVQTLKWCLSLVFSHCFFWGIWAVLNSFSLFRPGTTIAAAVGGVVLFFILLALLVFYLRRQKKLKRKETMRRILQEHEVCHWRCFVDRCRCRLCVV